ncbi:MAG: D-2-hydroxyacid dehydrogenase [Eubacteriales bacterium]|jgi:phosphoglycerate dehydrogenase-like enzyme
MKIVFLDRKTLGEDIDLSGFSRFGDVVMYDFTTPEEMPERVRDADILILNKALVNEQTCGAAEHLKLVCVTATGTNNLNKDFLDRKHIAWRNVAGYSTESVVQHTFAMLLYLLEHLPYYDRYVKSGAYINDSTFTHFERHFHELHGMTWGIIGLGAIGSRVGEVARCFGCQVQYYSTSGRHHSDSFREVDFDTLLATSDIISVHAPLNEHTKGLMDREAFRKMKPSSIFINVGRGPIIVEADLRDALNAGDIAAAGLDVLDTEPMAADNPLREVSDPEKLLITPHIAWATVEARRRLMHIIEGQVEDFLTKHNR